MKKLFLVIILLFSLSIFSQPWGNGNGNGPGGNNSNPGNNGNGTDGNEGNGQGNNSPEAPIDNIYYITGLVVLGTILIRKQFI